VKRALAWLELRSRATPLGGAGALALALLAAVAAQGLARPVPLGLGPGQATVLRDLAWQWLTPSAALIVLVCGTPALLQGLCRRRADGSHRLLADGTTLGPLAVDVAASLVLFGALALALAVPLVWVDRLVTLPPGALVRHGLTLAGATVLGTTAVHLGAARRGTFGTGLARSFALEALVVALAIGSSA